MQDKTIVITGGTSGVGYEITKLLYHKNKLIVISKSLDKLDKLSNEFKGIITYQANLANLDEVEIVANTILDNCSSIDVLINNAAVQYTPTFLDSEFDYNNISKEINLNFTSICSLTHKLLPLLLHSSKSIILNVNSGLALAPKTTSTIYCATKGALNIFTQSLRYQLEKTKISVQQVFLDLIDTNMTKGRGENKRSAHDAATQIIFGMERDILDHDIGKVKLLRLLLRIVPTVAKNIMKKH